MTQNIPEGSPRGRPLKFESVEVLEQRINAYFEDCDTMEDTRVWSHDESRGHKPQRIRFTVFLKIQ